MIQKIIKVGSSTAVVIPKEVMNTFKWKPGNKVSLEIDTRTKKLTVSQENKNLDEVSDWADGFIKKYKKALDALSQK